MPRIPLYNQGRGPTTQLAVKPLAPQLSSQVFEQAARAPGEMLGRALSDVGKVAADFEIREQKAELEAAEVESANAVDAATFDFVTNNVDDNHRAYGVNAGEFKNKWLDNYIEGMTQLNKRQKTSLRNRMSNRMDMKLHPGKVNAFSRGQSKKTEAYNESAANMVRSIADLKAMEQGDLPMSREDAFLLRSMNQELEMLYASAQEQGLSVNFTPDGVNFAAEREVLNGYTADATKSLAFFEQLEDDIDQGRGRYDSYDMQSRNDLNSIIRGHITELETVAVADATAAGNNALAGMTIATNAANRSNALSEGLAAAEELRRLGKAGSATKLETSLRTKDAALNAAENLMFAPDSEVIEFMSRQKELLELARPGEEATALAQYEAMQQVMAARKQAIQEDAAGYVYNSYLAKNNKAPTASQLVQYQREMGVSEAVIRPFTKSQFATFKAQMDEADAMGQMSLMTDFFGKFEAGEQQMMAMRGAASLGLSRPQMLAMSRPGDPRALDLLNSAGVDEAILKAGLEAKDVKRADLAAAVDLELEDYQQTIVGDVVSGYLDQTSTSGRLNDVFSIKKAMYKLAETYVVSGDDAETAAKKAAAFINERYDFQGFDNSLVRMPMQYGDKTPAMAKALQRQLKDRRYLETDLLIPGKTGVAEDVIDENRLGIYAGEIRSQGRWHTTDDDSGVILLDQFGNPVKKTRNEFGESGEFNVFISFEDLEVMADEAEAMGVLLPGELPTVVPIEDIVGLPGSGVPGLALEEIGTVGIGGDRR